MCYSLLEVKKLKNIKDRKINGYGTFAMFQSVKLHVHSSYRLDLYGITTKVGIDSFKGHSTYEQFIKLSDKYDTSTLYYLFLSNQLTDNIGNPSLCTNEDGLYNYYEFKKRISGINVLFKDQLNLILTWCKNNNKEFRSIFISNDESLSILCKMLINDYVCIETVLILDSFLGFIQKWEVIDDYVLEQMVNKLKKYRLLLDINKQLSKETTKQLIIDFNNMNV